MRPRNLPTHFDELADVIVSATEPATRSNGTALQADDLWRDTSSSPQTWNVWDGTAWQSMGGAGGSVAVDDDGTEVVAEASGLNFGTGLSVTDDGGGDVTIDLSATGDGAYAETIGDGSATSFAVTHNLGTEDVHVQVWDVSGTDPALANGDPSSVEATDSNTVTVTFGSAPTTDQYRVVVLASGASGGGGTTVETGFTALTDTTPADTSDTAYGTEKLTFTDPGTEATVAVHLTCVASDFSQSSTNARIKPQISFDGGSTWIDPVGGGGSGWQAQTNLPSGAATYRWSLAAQQHHTATPTGDVVVRARCQSASGAGADFVQGHLSAMIFT